MQNLRVFLITALATALVAGCSYYKLNVQQGNVLTEEMITQLRPGMTKRQVRYVLGSPLVNDPFHRSRWDYVYMFKEGDTPLTRRETLTVYFDGDALQRAERNGAPLALTGGGGGTPVPANEPETVLKADPELIEQGGNTQKKGFFRRVWEKIKR